MSRLSRSACLLAAVCVCPAAGAGGGASRTTVHFYRAFRDGSLKPGIVVTERVRGRCDHESEIEGRPYVWRCFWDNLIADPCFSASATSGSAFCPLAPWSNRGALVTARLRNWQPTRPQIVKTWPWGIRTATGQWCIALRTGTSTIRGLRVNHGCTGTGVLVGPVDRTLPTWTILYARRFDGNRTKLTRVPIRTVWW